MASNGSSGLVNPNTGGPLLPTALLATTVNHDGATVSVVIEGKPWLVTFSPDCFLHIRPAKPDALVLSIPLTQIPVIYRDNIVRKVIGPGAPAGHH